MSETPGIYPDANGIPFNQSIDILIDDKGIAALSESHEKPFEQWKLTDWIENMKIWPGLYEELELKNYAHRKLAEKKNAQYKALAIHMEYHLLHRRKLESQIYSEQLFSSTPQVNLMLWHPTITLLESSGPCWGCSVNHYVQTPILYGAYLNTPYATNPFVRELGEREKARR